MDNKPVIVFDGLCNLCNSAVQFVIKHDKKKQFHFASLQGEYGRKVLAGLPESFSSLKTFILIENGKVYTRSTAALRVARKLAIPVNWLYGFMIIPAFIRNAVYNFISKNRYKWFGKKDACMLPTPELKNRFLN